MTSKTPKPSLKGVFNAAVEYQMHSNPPIFGLHSAELGYTEIHLGELSLTSDEIDLLCQSKRVVGTYEMRQEPVDVYHPIHGAKKSTWKATSLKPSDSKPVH